MSRRIFKDIEEAIAREVRRITFHESRTQSETVLEETFDPFTGEIVQVPIEPSFYDSSADTGHIQYPHFFIRLIRTREDLYTNRVVPPYGKTASECPVQTSPKGYEIITYSTDGQISAAGNLLETTLFQIKKVQPNYLLKIINGNNIGTYIVDTVTANDSGPHEITVKNELVIDLPSILFQSSNREVTFTTLLDLTTIKVGDIFEDASAVQFNITAVNNSKSKITIDGVATPDLSEGSRIIRSGNVFQVSDPSLVRFLIMDPSQPITRLTTSGSVEMNSEILGKSPQIPLDAYYMVRIDSKDRDSHVEVINRVWEEFNPPRSALPVLVRSALSEEQLLTESIPSGGSNTVKVVNTNYSVGETVYIINDLNPTKSSDGTFPEPFKTKIVDVISTDQLVLEDTVPDTFTVDNNTKVVSNAEFDLLMFHFQSHTTKDVEGAQYWVHEFMFWVQLYIDKLEDTDTPSGTIQDISTPVEDFESNIIFEDPQ